MYFPCIICGKEFKTKDDWDKEMQRIDRLYPNFKKGVQKPTKKKWNICISLRILLEN